MSLNGRLGAVLAMALSLTTGQARSEETPDQLHAAREVIRATLLATVEWAYEQPKSEAGGTGGTPDGGKVSFSARDGKLIGTIDGVTRCDSEIAISADGFTMENCIGRSLQFVRSGNRFTANGASSTYTLRPSR